MRPEHLGLFSEQPAAELEALVARADVRAPLAALRATVTVGLVDLDAARGRALRRLEGEGLACGLWLLLPRAQGYFATPENLRAVEARVEETRRFVDAHGLRTRTLGFDFEPDLRELERLFRSPVRTLGGWAWRARDRLRHAEALDGYRRLAAGLAADGWALESYQFPLLLEDRATGASTFQRLLGAMDVPVEREVLMAYSSLLGPLGAGLLDAWAGAAGPQSAIAVGSTGGGVDPLPKLSWGQLARDLRLAARACRDVRVFSLEGCVAQGFLPRLVDFDWGAPVSVSAPARWSGRLVRATARGVARLLR